MPVREPKGRMLVREYMADRAFMREFSAEEREAYLLLSLFTDDAGWLVWDLEEMAAAMYRYEAADDREAALERYADHFERTGRLRRYRCGHAVMPRVANRPRGMKREYAVQDAHIEHTKSSNRASGKHTKSSRPPNLTLPNLTNPDTTNVESNNTARGRSPVRGGSSLKDIVGDFKDIVGKGGGSS